MQAQHKKTTLSMCYRILSKDSELYIVQVIKEREIERKRERQKKSFLFMFEIFMKLICRTHLVRD